MNVERKDHIDQKGSKQKNYHEQLRTHKLSTDDVASINSTNKGRHLLLVYKLQVVPWGIERMDDIYL